MNWEAIGAIGEVVGSAGGDIFERRAVDEGDFVAGVVEGYGADAGCGIVFADDGVGIFEQDFFFAGLDVDDADGLAVVNAEFDRFACIEAEPLAVG